MNTRLVGILIDSFPNILINGLTVTLPLTIISFALALVIALITALVQTAKIPVLRQLARFYVWVIRGTPVLVQLFVVFYGLPSLGVLIDPFPAAVAALLIMLGLFISGVLKPQSVQDVAEYLLANMAFLFVPSGVAILDEYASIQGSVVQLLIIMVVSLIITFTVTAYTVTGVIKLMERGKKEERA